MDEREFQYYLHFRAADIQRRAARERLIHAILKQKRREQRETRRHTLQILAEGLIDLLRSLRIKPVAIMTRSLQTLLQNR